MGAPEERTIFSLDQASALLPRVKAMTAAAVRCAEPLVEELQGLTEHDPEHAGVAAALRDVLERWADELLALGVEPKGPWLVDFDNGDGYYCWCYPESGITHYHGYADGFAGRVKIQ